MMKTAALKTLFWVVAMTFFGGAVLADSMVANVNTGANSTNNAKVDISNNSRIDIRNDADIYNDVNIQAMTGGNSASGNTGNGSVVSGSIAGHIAISNNVNSVVISGSSGNAGISNSYTVKNQNTGAGSINDPTVKIDNDNTVKVDNDANIDNQVAANLSTGNNSANKNTGNGSVKSGDIDFAVNINNLANQVMILLGKGGGTETSNPNPPTLLGKGGGMPQLALAGNISTLPTAGSDVFVLAFIIGLIITTFVIVSDIFRIGKVVQKARV
jgi:hypothetical protein